MNDSLKRQSKKQSLVESLTNVSIGFSVSLCSTFAILPILNIESSVSKNITMTIYYTIISIVRSYLIRRFFNKK